MRLTITFDDAAEDTIMGAISDVAVAVKAMGLPAIKLEYPEDAEKAERDVPSRVTYTATDKGENVQYEGVKEIIRLFIIRNPGCTAQQVEAETGQGRKSVESAIHGLRRMGIVRSCASDSRSVQA